jgi:hypothetical protein
MPDRQNWTAAMVLEWVLSRDMQAVLAIAADHGAVEVDTVAKKVTEIRPASMRDVERTHAIDESILDQGEKDGASHRLVRAERNPSTARDL